METKESRFIYFHIGSVRQTKRGDRERERRKMDCIISNLKSIPTKKMCEEEFILNWCEHSNHLLNSFNDYLTENELIDVTLSCEGRNIGAHRIVLAACSPYFKNLFKLHPTGHPIVVLKGVEFEVLLEVLNFIYNGEVRVRRFPILSVYSFIYCSYFLIKKIQK